MSEQNAWQRFTSGLGRNPFTAIPDLFGKATGATALGSVFADMIAPATSKRVRAERGQPWERDARTDSQGRARGQIAPPKPRTTSAGTGRVAGPSRSAHDRRNEIFEQVLGPLRDRPSAPPGIPSSSAGGDAAFFDQFGGQARGAAGDPNASLGQFGRAERTLSQQLQGLESTFQSQKAQLQQMFQFTESPQEKAALAFVLGDLEEQRKAGTKIIADQFAQAGQHAAGQAASMRSASAAEGAAMGDIYSEAASSAGAGMQAIAGDYADSGVGAGSVPLSGDATDWLPLMEATGAAQQAATQQIGSIAAEDAAALSSQLGVEGAAQGGALQRAALGIRADSVNEHNRRVNDRVGQERMAYMNAALGLQGQFNDRAAGLEGRLVDTQLDQAGMLENRYLDDRGFARSQQAQLDADRRDWMLGQESRRQDNARQDAHFERDRAFEQEQARAQAGADGSGSVVPTDPNEQIMYAGQVLDTLGPVVGGQQLTALVRSGALPPQILAYFGIEAPA